jgi:aryl-phospho-beta-D-glucosidase BglC (GH1 family)
MKEAREQVNEIFSVVETFVEGEFANVGWRCEVKWVESDVTQARCGWCLNRNATKVVFNNVWFSLLDPQI